MDVGLHVGSNIGSDQMWDQKAMKRGLKALRTVHTIDIDCWHKAHKAYTHRWVIIGAMPWFGLTSVRWCMVVYSKA